MKRSLLTLLLFLVGCKDQPKPNNFTSDLQQLREYFHIPSLAAIVTKGGNTIYEHYYEADSSTLFLMASLTKMFSGYVVRHLDEPVNRYVVDQAIPDSILVRHVLSHTSQGDVGRHFYYSGRFSWLTKVIGNYDSVINAQIIRPYKLRNTFLLKDSLQLIGRHVAKPYFYEGETKPGFIDYGFSAAAGITSTVRDIAKFGRLVNKIPVGIYDHGYFKQQIGGEIVLWAYGQYDCYSSLFIKVPSKDIVLVLAANNNLMSDPARLIYGDLTYSLFALSFFKNFLDINIDDKKAKAVAEGFLGRYDLSHADSSKVLLREVFKGKEDYATLTTMHNIYFLKEIAAYNNLPAFTEFDTQLKAIGRTLLEEDINNPYANIYMANYYQSLKNSDSASVFYRRVAEAKNFSANWYTREAQDWLKQHASTSAGDTSLPPR